MLLRVRVLDCGTTPVHVLLFALSNRERKFYFTGNSDVYFVFSIMVQSCVVHPYNVNQQDALFSVNLVR